MFPFDDVIMLTQTYMVHFRDIFYLHETDVILFTLQRNVCCIFYCSFILGSNWQQINIDWAMAWCQTGT